jgi:hypothetical protein
MRPALGRRARVVINLISIFRIDEDGAAGELVRTELLQRRAQQRECGGGSGGHAAAAEECAPVDGVSVHLDAPMRPMRMDG